MPDLDLDLDLDPIRRMLDDGVPVPPWIVRGLVGRLEMALTRYTNSDSCEYGDRPPCPCDAPWSGECRYCQAMRLERGGDIAAAGDALREAVRGP